ncbi:hypothetical protein [Pseudodesulfovibrio sp.]|uniref:hypothetical protein n=1 Tax=Pseudodesulfovibrio sp. TaxID=2035812 RepID=UPI0026149383|nr:hypothetical protein [Pseudodesulfovibrio sp.]MDD3311103.1 hypothetical protein [Pseudodesulfovibrio sp.]
MLFIADRVTECLVDERGYTLTLETGERYFKPHDDAWRAIYKTDPKAFKAFFDNMVNDNEHFHLVDVWNYEKI